MDARRRHVQAAQQSRCDRLFGIELMRWMPPSSWFQQNRCGTFEAVGWRHPPRQLISLDHARSFVLLNRWPRRQVCHDFLRAVLAIDQLRQLFGLHRGRYLLPMRQVGRLIPVLWQVCATGMPWMAIAADRQRMQKSGVSSGIAGLAANQCRAVIVGQQPHDCRGCSFGSRVLLHRCCVRFKFAVHAAVSQKVFNRASQIIW
jgi:hypothetical protein